MKIDLYNTDGTISDTKLTVSDKIFQSEPNTHVLHQAVITEMANKRQGTASSKVRSDVRGGGRKPWRQKGRGTARAGTIRSPLWVGGGRVFGPHPHSHSQRLPKKMNRLARISALSSKMKSDQITITEDFTVESGKTRDMVNILRGFGIGDERILLMIADKDEKILRAGRNIPNLQVCVVEQASTYDILHCHRLLIQKRAIEKIEKVLTS